MEDDLSSDFASFIVLFNCCCCSRSCSSCCCCKCRSVISDMVSFQRLRTEGVPLEEDKEEPKSIADSISMGWFAISMYEYCPCSCRDRASPTSGMMRGVLTRKSAETPKCAANTAQR